MKSFQGQTRSFEFELTIRAAKRIRSLLKVNLLKPNTDYDGLPLVSALYSDIELFVDVLYCLCVPDFNEDKVTGEEFAAELPDAWQDCRDAFFEEWLDFFLRSGLHDKAATIQKQLESVKGAMEQTWEQLSQVDAEKYGRQGIEKLNFDQIIQDQLNQNHAPVNPIPGSKSTSLPGSSGSIPIHSRSDH